MHSIKHFIETDKFIGIEKHSIFKFQNRGFYKTIYLFIYIFLYHDLILKKIIFDHFKYKFFKKFNFFYLHTICGNFFL